MADNTSNNKRIAKNTLLLYVRMLLLMLVSLYTSRVVLETLGVNDFGIYNIVGGVVVMFTFVSTAMATGTQRHLSYELGLPNGDESTIFSACFRIHLVLAFIVMFFAETVGLWFLNSKLNIPIERMVVANWVYQFSILVAMIGIVQVPYTAAIIAHEKMSFYAYVGIIDVLLKLGIVFLLMFLSFDKLLLYGALLVVVALVSFTINAMFCHKRIADIRFVKIADKSLYKRLLSFSAWSMFGALANVGYQQGVSIIINLFYGVVLNAAVGVANQINSAVQGFVTNFQQALNPQLVQAEAAKDRERQFDLICKSSKFSFFIMFIISYPLIINISYVLSLWLGKFPLHSDTIAVWVLVGVLVSCLSGPLWVSIYATGRIKFYQLAISATALSVLPIIYVGGKYGMTPEQMFVVRALNYVIVLFVQLLFLRNYIQLSVSSYVRAVLVPVIGIVILSIGFYYATSMVVPCAKTFLELCWQTLMYVIVIGCMIAFVGLKRGERESFSNMILSKIKK